MKKFELILVVLSSIVLQGYSQNNSYDVFTYQSPEYFKKSESRSKLQFNLTNNDTSFCIISLYKSQTSKADVMKDIKRQWSQYIFKQLTKADKEPARVLTEQLWDGWASTVAIGNFYQNKKKCVVMLNSFKKDKVTACVVYAFSDNSFKGPIELFSKELHLKNNK